MVAFGDQDWVLFARGDEGDRTCGTRVDVDVDGDDAWWLVGLAWNPGSLR